MQYNGEANDQDCISEVLAICGGATTDDYSLNEITRRFNKDGLDRYFHLAFESDGRWSFDDINQSSPPIESQGIVSGTNRYKFDDFTSKILNVLRIEILNSDGKGLTLIQENINNLRVVNRANQSGRLNSVHEDTFQELYINAPSGTPTHYLKYGDFVYLRPKPDYTLANALIAYFNRPAAYMLPTDTTKEPGVPEIHHQYLCRKAALPFLIEESLSQRADIAQIIAQDELGIKEHFSRRTKDVRQAMSVRKQNNR